MKMPPLLLGTAVLFWGWQSDLWMVALPVAALLVAAQYLPLRWDFSDAHLYRVADFCTVLFLLLAGYLFVTFGNPRAIVLVFQWLPLALLPLALAHAYGTRPQLHLGVLMWNLRRNPSAQSGRFNPSFPYFAIWVLAASAANARGEAFFAGMALLAAWPLASIRPRCVAAGHWAGTFACALAIGYGAQHALHEFQLWLEGAVPDWIAGSGSRTNPYRSMTDIGHIGELKQSDAIVLRVIHPAGGKPPGLLHRATYTTYAAASWIAHGAPFSSIPSGTPREGWVIAPGKSATEQLTVHDYSTHANPVLSLPAGTIAVAELEARRLTRNPLGAVQIERDPGFFSYAAAFDQKLALDAPPAPEDLRVARAERAHFAQLALDVGLASLPATAAIDRVREYFRENFQYSTFQARPAGDASPIVEFMLRTRSGHCEYFATATALLLRSAGVPARYSTGFAVQEYSDLERAWLVRQRHAHAWVRAHVDGAWVDVDTTPPEWSAVEARAASAWSRLGDLWSWLRFRLAHASSGSLAYLLPLAALVVAPFALWLAWRLYRSRHAARRASPLAAAARIEWPGADSEFYLVERRLGALGWSRRAGETATEWARRLRTAAPFDARALSQLAELHCRYRFDPAGITAAERAGLRASAETVMARADPGTN